MSFESDINSDMGFFASLAKARATAKEQQQKTQAERDKYLFDVGAVSRDIAARTSTMLPEKAKVKVAGRDQHVAIDEAFRDDDPLKGVGAEVMSVVSGLRGQKFDREVGNEELVQMAFDSVVEDRKADSYIHKLKQDTSFFGKPAGTAPGYEDVKKDFEERPTDYAAIAHGVTPEGIASNLGVAAGMNVALEGIGRMAAPLAKKGVGGMGVRMLAKAAGKGLFGLPAPGAYGFATKLAGLALETAAGFALFDAADEVVRQSDWGAAREDEPIKVAAAGMLAGGAGIIAGTKTVGKAVSNQLMKVSEQKVHERVAAAAFEKEGTVSSLMEYNDVLKSLEKSKKVSVAQADKFLQDNKGVIKNWNDQQVLHEAVLKTSGPLNTVLDARQSASKDFFGKATKFEKQEPFKLFTEAEQNAFKQDAFETYQKGGFEKPVVPVDSNLPVPVTSTERGVVAGRALDKATGRWTSITYDYPQLENQTPLLGFTKSLKVGNTKSLTGPNDHLLLPAPIEKKLGSALNIRQRVALRSFYDTNPGAKNAVIELGEFVGADNLSAITRYAATFPGRKAPASILGAQAENTELLAKVNKALTSYGERKAAVRQARVDRNANANWRTKFSSLDKAGKDEVVELASAESIPPEIGTSIAEVKSVARQVRDTPMKEAGRNAAIVREHGVKSSLSKRMTEAVQKKVDNISAGFSNTELDTIVSGGAEVSLDVKPAKIIEPKAGEKISKSYLAKLAKRKAENEAIKRLALDDPSDLGTVEEFFVDKLTDFDVSSLIKKGLLTVPIMSLGLLSNPDDSEASVGGMVSVLGAETVKKATGKTGAELISQLLKTDFVALKGEVLGKVAKWMDAPAMAPTVDAIKNMTTIMPEVFRSKVMTPGAVAEIFYKPEKNPMVELAARMTAVHNNSKMHIQAVKEILSTVKEYKNASREIRLETKHLVEKYDVPLAQAGYHTGMQKELGKRIRLAKDPVVIADLKQQLVSNKEALEKANQALAPYEAEWTKTMQEVSAKHSSARMSLALEDTADFKHYPWLKPLMSPDELSAVSMLKDLNKQTEARILEAGGKVIRERPFAHHAVHPDSNRRAIQNSFEGISNNTSDALNLSRLNSRAIGSRMSMPDIEYMFEKYVPDVERRIQTMQFWKKGQVGGWAQHKKDLRANNMMTPELDRFWKDVNKSLGSQPGTDAAQWAKRYYSMEVAWRLTLSPSVGFKHLMKQTGNLAIFPIDVWAKGISKAPKVLAEIGMLNLKERFPNTFKNFNINPSEETQLVRAMTNQGKYNSAIAELDMFDAPINAFDRFMDKANTLGSAIVGTVEMFDRAATILMGAEMAAKKGMTPAQAVHAMYDSVIKANFLSGVHNPAWVRDPHARAFFMFQGTPYKLLEQRLITMTKAGKDIAKAVGITWDEIKNLKAYLKEGEYKIKHGLIMDALTQTKDIYGQSVTKQFAVNMLTMGGLIWAGDKFLDSNIQDQVFHIPFVKIGGESPGVMLNPALSAGYKAWTKRHEEDRDMLFTEFVNNWAGTGGLVPSTIVKAMRLSEDDIPEIYKDSKLRYLFGVQATKE